ncbi:MAG: MFS transporter, partial [Pseudomonadota bacterium]
MSVNTKAYARFSLAYFCFFLFLGGIISFWPLWLSEQGFNERQIGVLIAVSMSTKLIAPSFWGWLADRMGRHLHVLQGCAVLGTLCFCLVFVRTDFWFLFVALFLFSFFWDAVMPQIEVLTLAKLEQNQDESNYTLVRLWGSVSFILVVLGLGLLFDYVSINTLPYFLLAFLCVFIASSVYLPNVTVEKNIQQSPDVFSVLKRPDVIGFLLVCALLQISHGPYYTWFSVYLKDLGYSLSAIGVLWTLSVIAEIVLFVFMRQLYKYVR